MIDTTIHKVSDGIYKGSITFNAGSRNASTFFWTCTNPGIKTPGLSFFLNKEDGDLLFKVEDVEKMDFHKMSDVMKTLFNYREKIYHEIAHLIRKEREKQKLVIV